VIFRVVGPYKNLDISFFRSVTNHAFDRRMDGRIDRILIARPRLHSMQRSNNAVSSVQYKL